MTEDSFITFPNGRRARLVEQSADQHVAELLAGLQLAKAPAVIVVIGGADDLAPAATRVLRQLFGRGLARAAASVKAVIVDGGTHAGVMALTGEAMADTGGTGVLLGVAPAARVDRDPTKDMPADGRALLDPNHSHFILTTGRDWGDEAATMYDVVKALADGAPTVTIVAGGGPNTLQEVVRSVRLRSPLIVIEGSGGVADQIAAGFRAGPVGIDDATLAEIVADGSIHLLPITGRPETLRRQIVRELGGDTSLGLAWRRFASLDRVAGRQQRTSDRMQLSILSLGVLGTLLAVVQQQWFRDDDSPIYQWLHAVIVLTPIVLSIVIAAGNRFKAGNKWLLMRAAAESIKREIFCYRVRAGEYRDPATREPLLAQRVEDITRRLARTEVNTSAILDYTGPVPPSMFAGSPDDGMSALTPDRYVDLRIGDQLAYFRGKTGRLERALKGLQWLILIAGGLGTLLAAFNHEIWISVTTAVVIALTAYLGYRQVENTLTTYNQTATDLENVRGWWVALSAEDQADPHNVDALVDHGEKVLQAELDGWVQRMQDALAELRKPQAEKNKGDTSQDDGGRLEGAAQEPTRDR